MSNIIINKDFIPWNKELSPEVENKELRLFTEKTFYKLIESRFWGQPATSFDFFKMYNQILDKYTFVIYIQEKDKFYEILDTEQLRVDIRSKIPNRQRDNTIELFYKAFECAISAALFSYTFDQGTRELPLYRWIGHIPPFKEKRSI